MTSPSGDAPDDVRAILFDYGGTLVYMDAECIADALARDWGVHTTVDAFIEAQCRGALAYAHQLAALDGQLGRSEQTQPEQLVVTLHRTLLQHLGVAASRLDEAVSWLRDWLRRELLWRRPVDRAAETLAALRQRGYHVGVVSNNDGRLDEGLRMAGLLMHVDFTVDSHWFGQQKPHRAIFERGLELAGVPAAQAAYVGDVHPIDVRGARNVGMHPVLHDPYRLTAHTDCIRIARLPDLLTLFA